MTKLQKSSFIGSITENKFLYLLWEMFVSCDNSFHNTYTERSKPRATDMERADLRSFIS